MDVPLHSASLHRGASSRKSDAAEPRAHHRARFAAGAAAIWKVVKQYPSTVLWPALVLVALLLAGIWGVTLVAQATADSTKDRVGALAMDVASWYRQYVVDSYAPLISLSVVAHHDPTYDNVVKLFNNAAPDLTSLAPPNALTSLQLAPNGVIRMAYPLEPNQAVIGYDLLEAADDLQLSLATIAYGRMALMGPLNFIQGGYGIRAHLPIFIHDVAENASFGEPDPLNAACGSACYNATTRTRFWGFATALIDLQTLNSGNASRLRNLAEAGYNYELLAPAWDPALLGVSTAEYARNMTKVASSSGRPVKPVVAAFNLSQSEWLLYVSPREGWMPLWYAPLLSVVIVVVVAVSALIFAMLLSRRQHQTLLEALLPREMIDHLKNDAEAQLGPRIMEAATTADVLLNMLGELLEGSTPDLRDIVLIRQQILQNMDIYQPLNLSDQLRDANFDDDVTKALMHQLGGKFDFSFTSLDSDDPEGVRRRDDDVRSAAGLNKSLTMSNNHDYATVAGALSMILSPGSGWYDNGPDISDAASDAALPTHDTEAAISPRPSNHHLFGRAATHVVRQTSWRCGSPEHGGAAAPSPRPGGGTAGGGSSNGGVVGPAAVTEGGPGLVPTAHADPDRPATASASAVSASCVRVTEEDGAAAAAAVPAISSPGGFRRGYKRNDSHSSMVGVAGKGRRRSALLAVSIADAHEGPVGKTLSSGSHGDIVTPLHGGHGEHHAPSSRLWASSTSRRSITGAALALGAFLAKKPPTPPAPVIEEVEKVLAQADAWQFDTWRLRDVTNGHPLSALGFYLIHRAGLIGSLKLKPAVLARLLRHIEAGYNDNPYHNATHAADVLQTLHVILHGSQMHVNYVDNLGLLAAYFAAIVHDYGHPGLTNDFLVATGDPLAVRYNDRSPLENHHAAAAFSAMRRSGLDLLAPLAAEQKAAFRKQVIEMVLATDMKQHFSLLSHFNTVHRIANYSNKPAGMTTPDRQCSNIGEPVSVAVGMPSIIEVAHSPKPLDETERLLSLQIVIKAADLGHLGEDLEVHKRWLGALEEEFFRQGDKERELGLPMSPLFDRAKQGVSKSQTGFYDFAALPLVHALSSAFPGARPLMRCFLGNYNYYRGLDGQAAIAEPRSGKLPQAVSMRVPAHLAP